MLGHGYEPGVDFVFNNSLIFNVPIFPNAWARATFNNLRVLWWLWGRSGGEEEKFEVKENELKLLVTVSLLCLDWPNSDFNLKITDNFMSGIPFRQCGGTAMLGLEG